MQSIQIFSLLLQSFSRPIISLIDAISVSLGKLVLVSSKELLLIFLYIKKTSFIKLKYLVDIWVVDYPASFKRFQLNYLVVSPYSGLRFRVLFNITVTQTVDSITCFYDAANWLEREIWDMFGVFFVKHPDLRRILSDYGFEGHPLRKDFPLMGYFELRFDDQFNELMYEPLKIVQVFRRFSFKNPWRTNVVEKKNVR